jgi:drug/metabolite transporter (DMT)-like permease
MSIVSPISAALSAALPAVFDIVMGTTLSPVTLAGIALALVAIVVVSIAPDEQLHEPAHPYRPKLALGLALLSGMGFSAGFIAMSFTSAESGIVPVIAARVVSISVAAVMALRLGNGFPVKREVLAPTLGAGVTDAIATVTMLYAVRIGPLAIASVLSSLFPVVVLALARIFLRERLHVWQRFGIGFAILAVLLSAVR